MAVSIRNELITFAMKYEYADTSEPNQNTEKHQLLDPCAPKLLPPEFMHEPVLAADCSWVCPMVPCKFYLNFLGPLATYQWFMGLGEDDKSYIYHKDWSMQDARFTELFYDLVEAHYQTHLDNCRVTVVGFQTDRIDIAGEPVRKQRRIDGPGRVRPNDMVSRCALVDVES